MGKSTPFFLRPLEIYMTEHPEEFEKKKKKSSGTKTKKAPQVYDCSTCGLSEKCKSHNIKRYGKGKAGILIIDEQPGRSDDKYNVPLVGAPGIFLKRQLKSFFDIDLDEDCVRTTVVKCYPGRDKKGKDKKATAKQILCCREKLLQDIAEVQPKLIICCGTKAIQAVANPAGLSAFAVSNVHGLSFPVHEHKCWAGSTFRPSFFVRNRIDPGGKCDDAVFTNDLADILGGLDAPLPQPLKEESNLLITDVEQAVELLDHFATTTKPTSFDFEANTYNAFSEETITYTVSITDEVDSAICIPIHFIENGKPVWTDEELDRVIGALKRYLAGTSPKVVQNYYMEEMWSRKVFGTPMANFIHDTMVTAHVLNCNRKTTGLGFQVYSLTGHDYKKKVNVANLQEESLNEVASYNNFDSRYTFMSYLDQKVRLAMDSDLQYFNDFFMRCLPVLANLKYRGVRLDTDIMDEMYDTYTAEKEELLTGVRKFHGVVTFESREDKKGNTRTFNIDSGHHVREVLYDICKLPKEKKTPTELGCTDAEALFLTKQKANDAEITTFIDAILRFRKCCSLTERVQNYRNLMDEDGILHPNYNLHTAATYRSSANDPNSQNVFNHDKELKKFRKCIVPRKGHIIIEGDYGGLEVCVIGMASNDPVLAEQIINRRKWNLANPNAAAEGRLNPHDSHRRWSAKLFQKSFEDITKTERYNGKNGFVFPSFYGSQPRAMARYEGFRGIGEKHIQKVYDEFWEEYAIVREWQRGQIEFYNQNGGYLGPMGCKRPGPLSYFQLFNNIIQGAGFHLLLDALQRIDDEMIARGLDSYAFLEVHDSIDFDMNPDEQTEVIQLSTEIMESKRFDWQRNIPLEVEWEIGRNNWYELEALEV
jgi:uracil-DNA glycosylase family 4